MEELSGERCILLIRYPYRTEVRIFQGIWEISYKSQTRFRTFQESYFSLIHAVLGVLVSTHVLCTLHRFLDNVASQFCAANVQRYSSQKPS